MILVDVTRSSATPLYLQIVHQMRRLVDEGIVAVGTAMPSTRALSERLAVNRSTVYRAYQELWALGYLDSRPGSYTRVRERVQEARVERPEVAEGVVGECGTRCDCGEEGEGQPSHATNPATLSTTQKAASVPTP